MASTFYDNFHVKKTNFELYYVSSYRNLNFCKGHTTSVLRISYVRTEFGYIAEISEKEYIISKYI